MKTGFIYSTLGVKIGMPSKDGTVQDAKDLNLYDKITNMVYYTQDTDGNTDIITGIVVAMPVVKNTKRQFIDMPDYYRDGASFDNVPLNNQTGTKTLGNDIDNYCIDYLAIQDIDDDEHIVHIPVDRIISIGDVTKVLHTVGKGMEHATISDAISAASAGDIICLCGDIEEDVTIDTGKDLKIIGSNNPVLTGTITCTVANGADQKTTLRIRDLTMQNKVSGEIPTASKTAITSYSKTEVTPSTLHIELKNVTFKDYTDRAIAISNADGLTIADCKFINCACGEYVEHTTGDYAVFANLIAVKDAVVIMRDCEFIGECGKTAPIMIAKRGGLSDAGNTELPSGAEEADIVVVNIANIKMTNPIVQIGAKSFTSGGEANTTGAFNCTIWDMPEMILSIPYNKESPTVNVDVNADIFRDEDEDFIISNSGVLI